MKGCESKETFPYKQRVSSEDQDVLLAVASVAPCIKRGKRRGLHHSEEEELHFRLLETLERVCLRGAPGGLAQDEGSSNRKQTRLCEKLGLWERIRREH